MRFSPARDWPWDAFEDPKSRGSCSTWNMSRGKENKRLEDREEEEMSRQINGVVEEKNENVDNKEEYTMVNAKKRSRRNRAFW